MSKINPLYERGDVKYFRNLHKERQREIGGNPVKYRAFYERLSKGMTLKDAIYTPRLKKENQNTEQKLDTTTKKPSLRIRFISLFR